MKQRIGVALAFALALMVPAAAAAPAAQPSVTMAWSRPAIGTGVVYATVSNGSASADRLVRAKSPIARYVEIHESTSSAGPMGAMASMHRLAFIAVPARGRISLRPGGYHLMLLGLKQDLKAGMTFPIELDFERGGWTTARVHVRAMD